MRKTWILLSFVVCSLINSGCRQDETQPAQATTERISQDQGAGQHSGNPRLSQGQSLVDLEPEKTSLLGVGRSSAEPALKSTHTEQTQAGTAVPHPRTQHGTAAYSHARFHGQLTASGERYDQTALPAGHPTYPFGTTLRMTNLANHKSVVVRINDRGPATSGRVIEVSRRAAKQLDFLKDGTAQVKVEVVSNAQS